MVLSDTDVIVFGGNFIGHDSAIFAIMPESKKIFGIATERLTRYKHDYLLPVLSIQKFIDYEQVDIKKVKKVVFCQMSLGFRDTIFFESHYERERALRKHFGFVYKKDIEEARERSAQLGFVAKVIDFCKTTHGRLLLQTKVLSWLRMAKKVSGDTLIRRHLQILFPYSEIEVRYYDHEYCHVVSALATSSDKKLTIVAFDGWGEKFFSKIFTFVDGILSEVASSQAEADLTVGENKRIISSIGGIYMYFTDMLGFTPLADEGKVEALAAYGKSIIDLHTQMLDSVTINDNNSIMIDKTKLSIALNQERFEEYLKKYSKEDISATVQSFLEDISLRYLNGVVAKTNIRSLALAGGVAANVINNLQVYEHITDVMHVTPAMADDGAAQGAACAYLIETGWKIESLRALFSNMPYYGTSYTREEVLSTLKKYGKEITIENLGEQWPERTARMVADGKIGAIFHGRMEWGPRALGNRSIIADPRKKDFRDIINRQIKKRPPFQPFCPSILAEEKDRLFDKAYLNKHMTCAFRLKKEFWNMLPSAMHIDGTARVQFVESKDNPNYYRLLMEVKRLTGFGVVINTSFNKHGRTIVESPDDAVTDFLDTDMDYLIIEGFLVKRKK